MKRDIDKLNYSKLYQRDTYTTPSLYYQSQIREYDMKSAGLSIIKEFKLLTSSEIKRLESLDKPTLVRTIGLLQIDNKTFSNNLKKGFEEARRRFFEANNIMDKNIVSIKKDAIFTRDKFCKNTKFGEIEFRVKNKYTVFLQLEDIEFYYNEMDDKLDVKGINDSLLHLHENGMIKVIKDVLKWGTTLDEISLVKKIQRLVLDYKEYRLPKDTYREFNRISKFKSNTKLAFCGTIYSDYIEVLDDNIDISFNFMKFIVPLLNIFYV